MAYVAGERKLFLLESSALDSNGEEMRSKHVPLEGQYQLGEFHHLRNELRKYSTKFEYCRMLPSTFDFVCVCVRVRAWQHISHSSTNFHKTVSVEERPFVTLS